MSDAAPATRSSRRAASRRSSAASSRSTTSTSSCPREAIVSLIGPNGAGKTTFFNCLTGLYRPTTGARRFAGQGHHRQAGRPRHPAGIARTFQNIKLFRTMTALENVQVGHALAPDARGVTGMLLRTPYNRREERDVARAVGASCCEFVGLKRHDELAMNLLLRRPAPPGDRARAGLRAEAAAARRADGGHEPAGVRGAAPAHGAPAHRARGCPILLIEHDMRVVMNVSDHITVLDHGEKIAEGVAARRSARTRGSSRPTSGARHERRDRAERAGGRRAGDGEPLLHVDDIHTFYGSIEALKGITIEVLEGEIVTLIGSNGAGKSTTLRSISGIVPPKHRHDPLRRPGDPDARRRTRSPRSGIAHSPEGRRIFPRMTVLREPRDGRVHAQRPGRDPRGHRARLRALPAAAGAPAPEGRARCPAASSRCSPWAAR